MGSRTEISWTDSTWNPVTGCSRVSPGCDNCYAEGIAHRFAGTKAYPNGFDVTLRPERLDQPLRWKRPRRIFVNSMSDLFHADVPAAYIAQVFAVMALAPQHTFQVLTKRPGRMRSLLSSESFKDAVLVQIAGVAADRNMGWPPPQGFAWPIPNVWLGVSVESQKWADVRIPQLLETPAAIRFISAEPLLGRVSIFNSSKLDRVDAQLDWVIVGGESGPNARRMNPAWARQLRYECTTSGIAFLFKQAGTILAREWGLRGKGADPAEWPEEFPREWPHG